jgi:alanyl-tRNA synthetase
MEGPSARAFFHFPSSIFHFVTDRLYYTDPYAAEFDAHVLRVEEYGGRTAAVLDRTAFYPTSGGQPHDTGTLNDARVVDVVDAGDGVIAHVLEGPLAAGPVRGRIDWARRFDHMQQHTGQHVLSAACDRLLQARTESFHLGSAASTIDLAREVTPTAIARAEDEANRVVWEDRPVHVRFADAGDAAAMPLRKESARTGTLRLIDVEEFDLSACGGTHVRRTGAIGIIAITSWERFKGGTRVEFVCGGRALRSHRTLRDAVAASVRALSVLPGELAAGIERLHGDAKDARREIKALQARLAGHEAAALAARGEAAGGVNVVVAALEGWDAGGLKSIAAAIVERPGQAVVLVGPPAPAAIVAARSADGSLDCAALLRALTARFGGKGGGRPELAQGGGLQGSIPEMVEFARRAIQEQYR